MGAMTAIAATGALASGIQAISGAKQRRDAKNALENYQRQELNNVAEGLQVSTLGSDLQREEQARMAASQVGALQGAGVRGVIGGLGRVEAGNQMVNREIAANLDAQQKQIDQMYAQDQANIRGMQEQREVGDISALSSQYNAGNQMMWQGIGGIAQSGMSAIRGGAFGKGTGTEGNKLGVAGFNHGDTDIQSSINYQPMTNFGSQKGYMSQFAQPQIQSETSGYGGSGLGGMNLKYDQFGNVIL